MANVSSSNSQKALVPKLRFHDANGAEFPQLVSETVGTLFSHISRRNSDMKNNNVITNSAEYGLIPQRDFFDKDIAVEGNTDKYYIIGRGDFVYNPRKSTTAPYGPFNCYQGEEEGIVSPLYTCLKPLYPEMADYLLWYFRSPAWHSYIYHNGAQGGARHDRVGMTNDLMDGIPVNLPCKTEQKKISEFLTLLDKRLTAQQQLVDALKSYKRGLLKAIFMQKISNGFLRNEKWEKVCIGDILEVKHGRDYKDQPLEIGLYPVVGTGGQICKIDTYLCDWPCVCIGRKGTIDKPQYFNTPFWSVDTLFYTKPKADNNPRFQYYLFETIPWVTYNEASGVPSLSATTIEQIPVEIPSKATQEKIAWFLSSVDAKIEASNCVLAELFQTKQSLLQQIFI